MSQRKTIILIGKIFRPVALIVITGSLFVASYLVFSSSFEGVASLKVFKTIQGLWGVAVGIIVFLLGFLPIYILFNKKEKPEESEYEDWGIWFFIALAGIGVYLIYKLM